MPEFVHSRLQVSSVYQFYHFSAVNRIFEIKILHMMALLCKMKIIHVMALLCEMKILHMMALFKEFAHASAICVSVGSAIARA